MLKLGLTAEQINNPQSACGSVCLFLFSFNQSVGPYSVIQFSIKSLLAIV